MKKRHSRKLRTLIGALMVIGGMTIMVIQSTAAFSASPFEDGMESQVTFWCLQFPALAVTIIGGAILVLKRK